MPNCFLIFPPMDVGSFKFASPVFTRRNGGATRSRPPVCFFWLRKCCATPGVICGFGNEVSMGD